MAELITERRYVRTLKFAQLLAICIMTNGAGRWRHACHANYETFGHTHTQRERRAAVVGVALGPASTNKAKQVVGQVSIASSSFIFPTCQNKFYCL